MAVAKLVVQLDPRKTEHCKEHTPEIHVVGVHHQHGEMLVEVRVEVAEKVGHRLGRKTDRGPELRALMEYPTPASVLLAFRTNKCRWLGLFDLAIPLLVGSLEVVPRELGGMIEDEELGGIWGTKPRLHETESQLWISVYRVFS